MGGLPDKSCRLIRFPRYSLLYHQDHIGSPHRVRTHLPRHSAGARVWVWTLGLFLRGSPGRLWLTGCVTESHRTRNVVVKCMALLLQRPVSNAGTFAGTFAGKVGFFFFFSHPLFQMQPRSLC